MKKGKRETPYLMQISNAYLSGASLRNANLSGVDSGQFSSK